jgi:hypothetical protein
VPAVLAWLRLDLARRRRSLLVLALLVALASGAVMSALAGARRGASAMDRLSAHTLPATSAVLANTPGFDWEPVRRLPNVEALTTFVVDYVTQVEGVPQEAVGFPPADAAMGHTIERPVVIQGRVPDPTRADEALVTPGFVEQQHLGVGDTVVLRLASPEQVAGQAQSNGGPNQGPRVRVRIVGVGRSPFWADNPGGPGGLLPSPGLVARYRANIVGPPGRPGNLSYVNALVRLKGGEASIPQFRRDFAAAAGRDDIDIWNLPEQGRGVQHHIEFESNALRAFALAVFLAALFLVGQAIVRYAASSTVELQTMRALGMTGRQSLATAAAGPGIAGLAGAVLGTLLAWSVSDRFPYGVASGYEPRPGRSADWTVLAPALVLVPVLVLAGAAAAAGLALRSARTVERVRRSTVAVVAARLALPVPVVVGSRFALEPGRGRSAVPVRPALVGAVVGVVGVLAAFTFSAGVADAAGNPERFGQTHQLGAFIGLNGQDFGPVDQLLRIAADDPDVAGVNDTRIGVALLPGGRADITLFQYGEGPKQLPVVLTRGRMATGPDEVVLAPNTLAQAGVRVGDRLRLRGQKGAGDLLVTGVGFVPLGPHNGYAEGGWVTTAGYGRLFDGFKYHTVLVRVRPGADVAAVAAALDRRVNQAVPDAGKVFERAEPVPQALVLKESRVLPLALGGFLALLALGAVGHALATAVRRRAHDIAVLRALGMTRWQSRGVVVTQASLLAGVGLLFGVPLGLAVGRTVWRLVADYTPVFYVPPVAVLALLLVGPLAVLAANVLAAWPGRRVGRSRIAHVLRTE